MNFFRKAKPMTVEDSGGKDQRHVIRKLSAAVRILLKVTKESKFRISENSLARAQSICFELSEYPDYVLRARGNELFGEKSSRSKDFVLDSSFYIMPDLWHEGFVSFESVHKAAHYIRLTDRGLLLDRYDGTTSFKEEASFLMGKATKQANMKRVTKWIQSVTSNEKDTGNRRGLSTDLYESKCNGHFDAETYSNQVHLEQARKTKTNKLDTRILYENTYCQQMDKEGDFTSKHQTREHHVTFDSAMDSTLNQKKIDISLDQRSQKTSILKNKLSNQVRNVVLEKENKGVVQDERTLSSFVDKMKSNNGLLHSTADPHMSFQLDQLCDEGCYLVEGNADCEDLTGQQYLNGPDGYVFKFITVDSDNFTHKHDSVEGSPNRKTKQKHRKEGVCYQNMSLQDEV